jgi:hypothetical protein
MYFNSNFVIITVSFLLLSKDDFIEKNKILLMCIFLVMFFIFQLISGNYFNYFRKVISKFNVHDKYR